MAFNAAESRIGVLCAAARVLRDDRCTAADTDSRTNADPKPHINANSCCTASNAHAAPDFNSDGCANAFCDAESERDRYFNSDADRYIIGDTDSQRNADHDRHIDPIADTDGDHDTDSDANGNRYRSAKQYAAAAFRADGNSHVNAHAYRYPDTDKHAVVVADTKRYLHTGTDGYIYAVRHIYAKPDIHASAIVYVYGDDYVQCDLNRYCDNDAKRDRQQHIRAAEHDADSGFDRDGDD